MLCHARWPGKLLALQMVRGRHRRCESVSHAIAGANRRTEVTIKSVAESSLSRSSFIRLTGFRSRKAGHQILFRSRRTYREAGGHEAKNGLLMRRDIHSLFDGGYVTVTPENRFEVSRRIKEEFDNGRHFYELHGRSISLPTDEDARPDPAFLQ